MPASPTLPLKLGAVAFTVLWGAWMLWSSGSFDGASIAILAVCAAIAGYLWYRLMRWSFQRMKLLPLDDRGVGGEP
jgi:hypothetical protein